VGQRVLIVDASLALTQAVFHQPQPTNLIINMHTHSDTRAVEDPVEPKSAIFNLLGSSREK